MPTLVVDNYIGTDGSLLIPLTSTSDNSSNLLSTKGVLYIAQTHEYSAPASIVAGNPIGLLLTLTYPATP